MYHKVIYYNITTTDGGLRGTITIVLIATINYVLYKYTLTRKRRGIARRSPSRPPAFTSLSLYIYIYICICIYVYIYTYIHIHLVYVHNHTSK